MADKIYQHKIPQGYLKPWAHQNPRQSDIGKVWVFHKDDVANPELKSPKSNFGEDDRYTLKVTGTRNEAVENALGVTETWFAQAFAHIRDGKRLDGHDRTKLAFFTAAMMVRTDHMPGIMSDMLSTIQWQAAKQEAKENIEPTFSNALAASLPDIVGNAVSVGMIQNAQMLFRMNVSIFVTDDEAGFVTGDEPVYICVPGGWNSFLGHEAVEVTMPLSPRHLAFYSWKIPPQSYAVWGRDRVNRLNSRTIDGCQKYFISHTGTTRPEWFLNDLELTQTAKAS